MNDLTKPNASELAIDGEFANELLTGLMESRTTVLASGVSGKALLRLLKDGYWVFGQDDSEVQQGSRWAINIKTLGWGFVCWTDYPKGTKNKRLGLISVPAWQPLPKRPDPIEGFPFKNYITFDAVCLDGEDAGTEVTYGNNSDGGLQAYAKLRDAVIARLRVNTAYPCPVVTLGETSYKGNYGKIYKPVFEIVGWADLGGNPEPDESQGEAPVKPTPPPAAEAAPVRQRKAPLNAANEAQAVVDPQPTQRIHTGQRRRPSAQA